LEISTRWYQVQKGEEIKSKKFREGTGAGAGLTGGSLCEGVMSHGQKEDLKAEKFWKKEGGEGATKYGISGMTKTKNHLWQILGTKKKVK